MQGFIEALQRRVEHINTHKITEVQVLDFLREHKDVAKKLEAKPKRVSAYCETSSGYCGGVEALSAIQSPPCIDSALGHKMPQSLESTFFVVLLPASWCRNIFLSLASRLVGVAIHNTIIIKSGFYE